MAEDAEITARITADPTPFLDAVRRAEESAHGLERAAKDVSASVGRSMDSTASRVGQMARQVQTTTDRVSMAFARMMPVQMMARAARDMASRVYEAAMSMARLADDAADTHAYLKRTFGSLSGEATAWAKETSRAYGVYSAQVESYYTRLYEALSASGMGSRAAEEYAQELTKLRYDLSAVLKWYSEDQISEWVTKVAAEGNEEAFKKLMAGQSFEEAAKKAGLWSASMDAASKKAAMAKMLMSEYSDEVGAWSANLNTASGAEARLSASIDELQTKIGQVLSPVLAGVLNIISDIVDGINGFADAIGRLTGAVETVDKASLVREVADAMSMLADSTEAASEASAGLAGFDRLNRLSTSDGEGEQSKGLDLSSGLDSWMRLWAVDAREAETAADALWDSVLDSGLSTEEELRARFGDLFGWMADQSDVDMELRTDAVEDAWQGLEEIVSQYQEALQGIGVTADRLQKARAGAQAHSQAQAQEKALLSKLDRLKAGRGSEEDVADIERELEDVRRTLKDTSADAKLYQAVVQLRTAYGTGIQGLYGSLAQDLGTYSGSIVAQLSEHTTQELSGAESAVAEAIAGIPVYSDEALRTDLSQWLATNSEAVSTAIAGIPSDASLKTILTEFEDAGIDVSDPSAVLAAEALTRIAGDGKEEAGTLGELVDGLGGVESAVSSVTAYDDTQLRLDATRWIQENRAEITQALSTVPSGADIGEALAAFEEAGIDVSDPAVALAVGTLASSMPAPYSDTNLKKDISEWLTANSSTVSTAIAGLPAGSDIKTILTEFEQAGIDVSDPSALAAASELATIGKAYKGETTLGGLVTAMGGVETAIGGIAIPVYSDTSLKKDLSEWMTTNSNAISTAIGGLPASADIKKVLTEFEAAGIDVKDPNALAAATALATIGSAYDEDTTLGSIVTALGGVETAVGGIAIPAAYSDTSLKTDISQWLATNAGSVTTAIGGLPTGAGIKTILEEFEQAGIDVSDPSATAAASALESIGKAYAGETTLGGIVTALGGVESAVGSIAIPAAYSDTGLRTDISQWLATNAGSVTTAIGGLPTGAGIKTILEEFEQAGIDVSDPSALAAASALETIGKAYAGETTLGGIVTALGGVQGAVGGISFPAYSDEGIRKDLDQWLQTNASTVETAINGLPKGSDLTRILTEFEAAGIDVSDPSAVLAASQLETIGKAYGGATTLKSIVDGLGGVETAVGGIALPEYSDAGLRKDLSEWLTTNATTVETAIAGLPKGSDISTILTAFEAAGIDVSDSSALAAAGYLETIGKAYQGTATLGGIVDGLGGVETAVGGIAPYDDTELSKSLDEWLSSNATTVSTAINGLPVGADIKKILTEFEAAGIDVSDANAQAAAGYLETIGKAYSGQTTLGGIVTALGGVQEAVGGISLPAYDDTELSKSLDQWLQTNASTVETAINGLPKDSDLTKILTEFEAQGIDVKDASAVLAASRLATISQAYSGQTTIGDIVDGLGGVETAVGGLDVSPSVTVNEPDYSQVISDALADLGDPTVNVDVKPPVVNVSPPHVDVDVAAPSVTVNAPDYSPVLEQTLENTAQMKAKLEALRLAAEERASEDAKQGYEEAKEKATQETAEAVKDMAKGWSSVTERAGSIADLVGSVVDGIADMVAAQDELRDIETREAEQGLPDSVVAMLSKLGNTDNRTELREALMAGKSWYQLNALYRKNAQGAGITSSEWASAVAAVKAMPAQTPAQAPAPAQTQTPAQAPAQSTSYFERQKDLVAQGKDLYGFAVERARAQGDSWSDIQQSIQDYYAKLGIYGYAQGGVFEPNSPVLAVLGDNRAEKEVAAPYSTIVKAVREALGSASSGASQTIQIVANVVMDGRTVAKATFPYLREEGRRLGVGI